MKVKDMMHKGIEWVAPDAPVFQIAQKMKEKDIGAIPVCENEALIGIITDRDITLRVVADHKDPTKLTAKEIMTKDTISCRDAEDVDDAVRLMESKKIRRLPVLDEQNRLIGMLSLGDISQAMPRDITAEVMRAVASHHP